MHLPLSFAARDALITLRTASRHVGLMLADVVAYLGLPATGGAESGSATASLRIEAADMLPPLPSDAKRVMDYGTAVTVWRLADTYVLRGEHTHLTVDPEQGEAQGQTTAKHADSAFATHLILALFLLLRPHALFPLHAAALALDGRGLLIAGGTGSGKSTLAYALVRCGWHYLSDDSILLHPVSGVVETLAFRQHFALGEDAAGHFPEITDRWTAPLVGVQKHSVPIRTLYPSQAASRCVPHVLIFSEISEQAKSDISPISESDALLRLIRQSALLTVSPAWTADHLSVLKGLVGQVTPLRLRAGHDVRRGPTLLDRRLRDALASLPLPNPNA